MDNKLNLEHTDLQKYKDVVSFRKLLVELRRKKWVVYCEPPMLGVKQVIDYLGRYVHRVALANYRIVAVANDKVTFEYKKYAAAEAGKAAPVCLMTLDAEEFVRRFAQHILPLSFQKVRYYGFYASAAKKKLEVLAKQLQNRVICVPISKVQNILYQSLKLNPDVCPSCQCSTLETYPIPSDRSWIPIHEPYIRPPPPATVIRP